MVKTFVAATVLTIGLSGYTVAQDTAPSFALTSDPTPIGARDPMVGWPDA
jgi:hypothetical protein